MAQATYTPISLYHSTTAAAVPTSANLVAGELALNTVDEKLYFKNSAGTVKLLASNATSAPVLSFQTSLGGLTPSTATTGVVTLAGTLNTTSGGTGLTSFTAGDVPYYASGSVLSKLAIGTAGQFLTSTGTAPQWSTLSGVAVTTFSAGTTGFTPSSATSGAVTLAGTLATTNGGTGLTSFTSGGVVYASSTSALATGSALTFDGTTATTPRLALGGTTLPAAGTATLFSRSSDSSLYIQPATGGVIYLLDGSQNTMYAARSTSHEWAISNATALTLNSTSLYTASGISVGIGTSLPTQQLDVTAESSANATIVAQNITATSGGAQLRAGNPQNLFIIGTDSNGGGLTGTANSSFFYSTSTSPIVFLPNGSEKMRLTSAGIVTMSAYGAGAATFSAAGVISSVSDETWKIKDGVPSNPDVMLQKLEPCYWFYNEEKAPIFGQERQLGFFAQNVNVAIGPEAAPEPEEGKPWGYYDRSVLAVTVMSLQKSLLTIESLKARLDAANL